MIDVHMSAKTGSGFLLTDSPSKWHTSTLFQVQNILASKWQ